MTIIYGKTKEAYRNIEKTKINNIIEKYLMEKFSTDLKSTMSSATIDQKIENIADYAVTVSSEWMNIKKGQFWDFSKREQLKVIERDLDVFIRNFEEGSEDLLQVPNLQQFVKNNKKIIIKSIRKFIFSIYG